MKMQFRSSGTTGWLLLTGTLVFLATAAEAQTLTSGSASPFVGPSEFRSDYSCSNPHQCEFQEFDNPLNLALAHPGGAAIAVTKNNGYVPLHGSQYLNDGHYGNGSSWISAASNSWLKIDLGAEFDIQSIKFGRDRIFDGTYYNDRDPGNFTIEIADQDSVYADGNDSDDAAAYTEVFASSFDGLIDGAETLQITFSSPVKARYIKIRFASPGVAVDEVEVLGPVVIEEARTDFVNVDDLGTYGNSAAGEPSISADGRYVAFHSYANNLVPGDYNHERDVFVHDRLTRQTRLISVNSLGVQANEESFEPSISADGRYVAFRTHANNLVTGDTNGHYDIFVHDRDSGQTERVSVNSLGEQAGGWPSSVEPSISGDGRYVAFSSYANNLVGGDTNGAYDVFVHDRNTGLTERVSVDSLGVQANAGSHRPSISLDGRYVAFDSYASNLASGDDYSGLDVFVHDRDTGETELVSIDSLGVQGNNLSSEPSIGGDGRYVAFQSFANNLVPSDTNGEVDVFVYDRDTGQTERVSVDSLGEEASSFSYRPSINSNGRYVAFWSLADNLVANDTNGTRDVFVHDREVGITERVSVRSDGSQVPSDGHDPSISADGIHVAFLGSSHLISYSGDPSLQPPPPPAPQVFVRSRGGLANQPPVASAAATPNPAECTGPLTEISLDGSGSYDPDPDDSVASWNWGGDVSTSGEFVSVDFAPGAWNVDLTVQDTVGATDTDSIAVTIEDTTPPLVNAGGDATLEATSAAGAPYSVPYTIDDLCDPSPSYSVVPMPPVFPLGTTTVSVSANDASGNSASDSADITVLDTTAPLVMVPADIEEEATSSGGNVVTYSASADDLVDGPLPPNCAPPSGNTFGHGSTNVICSATDAAGNTASAGFNVTVEDTKPPSLTLPDDIQTEAAGPDGAPVDYVVDATDTADDSVIPECLPPSGSLFALGLTSVSCTAADDSGNVANGAFGITIVDTTTPQLIVPPDLTMEATEPAGAPVSFAATATDVVDGAVLVACAPASGSTFGLGSTLVDCAATDNSGNAISGAFYVTVVDTTPPELTAPADITSEATSAAGANVSFSATALDVADSAPVVSCVPASGSLFAFGTTAVECSATDASGNSAQDSFSVFVVDTTAPVVTPPPDVTAEATSPLTPLDIGTAGATDNADVISIVSDALADFPVGLTVVTWTAYDAAGNSASTIQNVTVTDTTPPVVTVGPDIKSTATGPAGAAVSFPASALDLVDQALTPECTPASGSTFGHGQTAVDCNATDNAGNTGFAGFIVTVLNASPTADDQAVTLDEDTPAGVTLTGADADGYPAALAFAVVDPPTNGLLSGTAPDLIYTPNLHYFGADSFTFRSFDGASYSAIATVSITVDPVNDLPVISVDRASAGLQYSDTIGSVVISATDVDDALGFASAWTANGGAATAGLPAALDVSGGCTPADFGASPRTGSSCSWTFSGQMLQPSGDYDFAFTVTDEGGDAGSAASATAATELLVAAESASIAFDGANPVAVPVIADGVDASEPFSLLFQLRETPPDAASFAAVTGDISQAIPEVSVKLTPVGPGSTVNGVCTASDNGQSGYAEVLTFACDFDAVPVNTYSVDVLVNGGYYVGSDDDVLTVYDPSLGFTTGGGWFYWPGTMDKTSFGYTMKYNRKRTSIQGSLLVIRHLEGAPEGEDKWRLKSNALEGLSLGDGGAFGWAAFSGKGTFTAPGADAEGNHSFTVYAEDAGDPGVGLDRFWIQTRNKTNAMVQDLSLDAPAVDEAAMIEGGNIFAPHGGGKGRP